MVASVPDPRDLLDLTGRVAVVTGASQGIGAGIATRLAAAGASVAVHHRSGARQAAAVVAAITKAKGTAVAIRADLTDEEDVDALFRQTRERLGPVDILVNNAGQNFPLHPVIGMALAEWQSMIRDNTEPMFLCTRAAAAGMRARGGGAIVNIGSISASNPATDHSHYNSAKAAVLTFTRSCAQEFGPYGIRVNAVSPGPDPQGRHRGGVARRRQALAVTRAARAPGRAGRHRRRVPVPGVAGGPLDHRPQPGRRRRDPVDPDLLSVAGRGATG